MYNNEQDEFLRSHDFQFTIGNDSFQEVVCHNERLGGNDEASNLINLIILKICTNINKVFLLVVH